jgi:uncharacterized DUF497 family protein
MNLQFEWDEPKAKLNFKKHGIDFEEAKTFKPWIVFPNENDNSLM